MNGTDLPRNSLLRLSFLPILAVVLLALPGCSIFDDNYGKKVITGGSGNWTGTSISANNQPAQEGGGMASVNAPTFDEEGNVIEDALGDLPATPASEVSPRTDYPDSATGQETPASAYERRRAQRWAQRGAYEPPNDASAHAYLAAARIGLPKYKYLGTEFGGVINLDNGYRLQDDESSIGGGVGGSFGFGTFGGQRLRFNLNIARNEVDVSGPRGGFDPGPGTFLLIPGTGDGPFGAGFALAPGAPGVNAVTTSDYRLDYSQTSFTGKFSTDFWCDDDDDDDGPGVFSGLGFTPHFGLTYNRIRFEQNFGGAVPGFGVNFQYDTSLRNNSYGVILGGQVMKPIAGSPVMLRAGLTGQADFNRAKGSDSLDFTGFGSQTMRVKNNDTTFSYTANAGVTVGAQAPIRFDVDLFYGGIGNTPSISRDGVGPSRLEFENSDFYGTALRTTFRF
ncbi:MAG: hypothetical protein Q8J92_11630 [Parvibaculum sp.]|nr:hypothetical protein [Parvibaculum sp.]